MNKRQKLTVFFIVVLIIAGIAMNFNQTKYATITGESFNIPKIEGNGYFERGEDL